MQYRLCAVWGGGQILGRPISPLESIETNNAEGVQPLAPTSEVLAASIDENASSAPVRRQRVTVPVQLDPSPAPPTRFSADWIVSTRSHANLLSSLSTSLPSDVQPVTKLIHAVNAIVILPSPIPFPPPISSLATEEEEVVSNPHETDDMVKDPSAAQRDESNTNLFVFPPRALSELVGTVTVLQSGRETFACPDGYRESCVIVQS